MPTTGDGGKVPEAENMSADAGRHAGRPPPRHKNHEKTYLECAKLLDKLRIDSTRGMNKWIKFGGDWESLGVSTDPKLKTCPIF